MNKTVENLLKENRTARLIYLLFNNGSAVAVLITAMVLIFKYGG